MTKKLNTILHELMKSGQSESIAVADCLLDISTNGRESNTDTFLLVCAGEIRDVAESIIDRMAPPVKTVPIDATKLQQLAQRIIKDYATSFEDPNEPISGPDAVDSLGQYVELAQAALGLPITTATRNETF